MPPSPKTKPSRPRSNGREAVSGESFRRVKALRLPNPATPIGETGRSTPPARQTSTHPRRTHSRPRLRATFPLAHAAATVVAGPVIPSCSRSEWVSPCRSSSGCLKVGLPRSAPSSQVKIHSAPIPKTKPMRMEDRRSHQPLSWSALIEHQRSSCSHRVALKKSESLQPAGTGRGSRQLATLQTWFTGSKWVIRRTPEAPAKIASAK